MGAIGWHYTSAAPAPADIRLDGEPTVTIHDLDTVPVKHATVLDKDGQVLASQPAVIWSVTPTAVAYLDGGNIIPVGNGEADVEARIGEVRGTYHLVVALPDKVEIAGYTAGQPWPVGQGMVLTAVVKAGDSMLDGYVVSWSSSDDSVATVDATGTVTGISTGRATIAATSGALTGSIEVKVDGGRSARRAETALAVAGNPTVDGALDKSLITAVIRRNLGQIRYCYEREFTENPHLGGKITVKFVIAKDGTVASATTASSTMGNPAVESCVNGRFMRFQFPEPERRGSVIVAYPFVFSPG